MRRVAIALLVAAAGLAAAASDAGAMVMGDGGGSSDVAIGFAAFAPQHVDVLAGDTVMWSNQSARTHTVTADDDSWGSARLPGGSTFAFRFAQAGSFLYHCQLHPFMRGEVDVHDVLLDMPASAASPGRPFPLTGRAAVPADGAVSIEADEGAGFHEVGTATAAASGAFSTTVTPRTTTTYRAVANGQASPPVQLLVLDRKVKVSVSARRGQRYVVSATVTPASPGATIVLQLRLRDRFGWWPMQQHRLDSRSRTRFVLRFRRRVPARVLLTLPDGATPLAISRTVHVGRR